MSNNPNLNNNNDEFARMIGDQQMAFDEELDNIVDEIDGNQTPQGLPNQQEDVQDILNNLIGQQTQGNDPDEIDNPLSEGAPNEQERARLQAKYQADQQRAAASHTGSDSRSGLPSHARR